MSAYKDLTQSSFLNTLAEFTERGIIEWHQEDTHKFRCILNKSTMSFRFSGSCVQILKDNQILNIALPDNIASIIMDHCVTNIDLPCFDEKNAYMYGVRTSSDIYQSLSALLQEELYKVGRCFLARYRNPEQHLITIVVHCKGRTSPPGRHILDNVEVFLESFDPIDQSQFEELKRELPYLEINNE